MQDIIAIVAGFVRLVAVPQVQIAIQVIIVIMGVVFGHLKAAAQALIVQLEAIAQVDFVGVILANQFLKRHHALHAIISLAGYTLVAPQEMAAAESIHVILEAAIVRIAGIILVAVELLAAILAGLVAEPQAVLPEEEQPVADHWLVMNPTNALTLELA